MTLCCSLERSQRSCYSLWWYQQVKTRQNDLMTWNIFSFFSWQCFGCEVSSCGIMNSVTCWILVGKAMFRSRSKWTPSTSTKRSKHLYNLWLWGKKESRIILDFLVLHHPWIVTFAWHFMNLFIYFGSHFILYLFFILFYKLAAIKWWWGKKGGSSWQFVWKECGVGVWSRCFYFRWDWQRCRVVSAAFRGERLFNRRVGSLSKAHEEEWQRLPALWLAKNSPHRRINKEAGFDMSHLFLLLMTAPSWAPALLSARQVWRSESRAHIRANTCRGCSAIAVAFTQLLQNVCVNVC